MEQMKRFALYYAPAAGEFANAAAAWLGWDALGGCPVAQPDLALPRPMVEITAEPRKYGFHGTIKPPFRLAEGVTLHDLHHAAARLASSLAPVTLDGLKMVNLHGFLAFVPTGDVSELQALAARVVAELDAFRAPLTPSEIARRRPESLTPRQRELLDELGYPYVMEEFFFHLTLTGRVGDDADVIARAAAHHFEGLVPSPFVLGDICLFGEDAGGQFHLLHRYPFSA